MFFDRPPFDGWFFLVAVAVAVGLVWYLRSPAHRSPRAWGFAGALWFLALGAFLVAWGFGQQAAACPEGVTCAGESVRASLNAAVAWALAWAALVGSAGLGLYAWVKGRDVGLAG